MVNAGRSVAFVDPASSSGTIIGAVGHAAPLLSGLVCTRVVDKIFFVCLDCAGAFATNFLPGSSEKRLTGKGGKLNTSQAEPVAANSWAVGQFPSISCEAFL